MKSDMGKDIIEYLKRHPERSISIKYDAIDTGESPVNRSMVRGRLRYEIQMKGGKTVVVYPGEMFPE